MNNVYDKVANIVAEQLGITLEDITLETTLEDLNADSLDVVEILMTLENEFNISVPDEEIENFRTPIDIQKYIVAKTQPE